MTNRSWWFPGSTPVCRRAKDEARCLEFFVETLLQAPLLERPPANSDMERTIPELSCAASRSDFAGLEMLTIGLTDATW